MSMKILIIFTVNNIMDFIEIGAYATFTLNGFDGKEPNLTFVKIAFRVLKLRFLACSMK